MNYIRSMYGTNISSGTAARLAEAVNYAAAPDAADGWHTPEARRERKARDMELVRMMAVDLAARMSDTIAGRIPQDQCPMLEGIKDPVAAFANLSRAIVQIGMYEDRLDESAEERAQRLAAETAARAQAAKAAEGQRRNSKSEADRAVRRIHFQRAMREIALDSMPDADAHEREEVLDELFLDFDYDSNASYDGDLAETILDLCARAGFNFEPKDPAQWDEKPDPAERRAAALKLVRSYLDATASRGDDCYDEEEDEDPPQAQGPPH